MNTITAIKYFYKLVMYLVDKRVYIVKNLMQSPVWKPSCEQAPIQVAYNYVTRKYIDTCVA